MTRWAILRPKGDLLDTIFRTRADARDAAGTCSGYKPFKLTGTFTPQPKKGARR